MPRMTRQRKVELKEIGLDVGIAVARHFYHTDYLHYGYWIDDLKVVPHNVFTAQENYANLLVNQIPKGTKTILDVGCGTGKFAQKLIKLGYTVDCVSPSLHLTKHVRQNLGNQAPVFECFYEELTTNRTYDLILFSESFQYLRLLIAMNKTIQMLNDQGHILICDFFRKNVPGKSPISGGHDLGDFYKLLQKLPVNLLIDQDITGETAPSLDIMDRLLREVIRPIWDAIAYYMSNNYPWFSKGFSWLFRKKIKKIHRKYFAGGTSGASFEQFKSYRLFLLQKH